MKKKFLALVLTLAMVLSLVPVTALAADTPAGGASRENTSDNLTMKKTVTPNEDGTYTVRLESYATGEVKTTTTTEPRNIVLLLDVSGSMGDPFTRDIEKYQPVYKDSLDTNKTYLIKQGWWYEEVTYCPTCKKWTRGCHDSWLTGNHREGKIFTPTETENDTNNKHTQFYQYVYISGKSKMDALKTAVNNFIEGIAKNSPQSNISIVKFAGEKTDIIGNNVNRSGKNYTQIVKELTKVDNTERVNQLKKAVSELKASGSTASDYGLEKAKEALQNVNQDKVVVLFTDGEPNHQNGFDYKVATDAVNTAKTLKEKDTTIYTVGVFKNPSDDINLYMSSVSSNYPNATAKYEEGSWLENDTWTVIDGDSDSGTYYKTADSADELINAFKTISSQVSSTHLNGNAVVVDKVPSNFKAPANAQDVTLKVADYQKGNTFGEERTAHEGEGITATVKDGTVSVTGFNFSENWCGLEGDTAHGKKLIIEFTIKCTNYGGTQPTNAGAYIKAKEADEKQIIKLDDPTVPVKVQLPDEGNSYTDTKVYDGEGFDIKDEIGEIVADLVPVDGTKNQFIDLTYEIKDNEGNTVGTYTIPAGRIDGTWSAANTEIKTGPNVDEYKYTITVTGQDTNKEQPNNKASKTCEATFTITQRDATFTGESDSVTWTGKEQTITAITAPTDLVPGHTYKGGLTYVAKGTEPDTYNGTFTGTAIIKDANGTDVTANYNVKTEPGTLTITDSTSPVTVTFRIVGGTWSDDNTTADKKVQVTLTNGKGSLAGVTIPTGSPSDGYTGDGAWTNDAGITGDPVEGMEITKDTIFTLTYPQIKPVITHVDVIFKIVGGTWSDDGTTNAITKSVQLTDGTGSLAGVEIPTGVADADHQGDGTWDPATPKAETVITQDGDKVFTLTFQKKEEQKPADPEKWDTSKSKTATTNLDSNYESYESKVMLSLPSAEENLATDVVLVLDASKCTKDMLQATIKLIKNLEKQVELGANIKVGIVMFKGNAVPFRTLEKAGDLKTLRETFTGLIQKNDTDGEATKRAVRAYVAQTYPQFMNSGTNIPAGLALAKEMLAGDNSVTDARKYVVLVSDGNTYLFCHQTENGGYDYNTAYTRTGPGDYRSGISENNNWAPGNKIMLAFNEARNSGNWENYLKLVEENNNRFTQYDFKATAEVLEAPKGTQFPEGTPVIPTGVDNLVVNSDVSRYQTAQLYRELQNTYNCYYCFLPASSDYDTAATMMKQITPEKYLVDATAGTEQDNIFSGITKDIIYLLGTGSTVKDEIGSGTDNKGNDYNFDFVDKAEAMTLTVGKTTYVTQKAEAATLTGHETSRYLFKAEDVVAANQAEAPYVLHYYQNGEDGQSNECFVWDINVNVSNFDRVQLTYTVKLTNPQSQKGTTYGVYDPSGKKQTPNSSLYTNLSATLKPVNSNGVKGADEAFLKPTVSYTIKGSSGGHGGNGGGTVTIPDDVPTGLNGKDHYAYVVGYPDGMVYPQKNITRAEVATIFFRLLTDETREANMTKSNSYNDMKDGAWYTCAVSTLSKMGIIKGYEDGSFKPDASISRAEFAAIAARFDPDGDKTPATFSDVSSHWAKDEISIAANHGWIKGYEDGSFKPDQKITRAETMTLVNRVLKRLPETKDDLHKDMKTWPDNQNESAWFYLAVQEATNSHYQKLKKDGTHETWESMRETRDWAALEK